MADLDEVAPGRILIAVEPSFVSRLGDLTDAESLIRDNDLRLLATQSLFDHCERQRPLLTTLQDSGHLLLCEFTPPMYVAFVEACIELDSLSAEAMAMAIVRQVPCATEDACVQNYARRVRPSPNNSVVTIAILVDSIRSRWVPTRIERVESEFRVVAPWNLRIAGG